MRRLFQSAITIGDHHHRRDYEDDLMADDLFLTESFLLLAFWRSGWLPLLPLLSTSSSSSSSSGSSRIVGVSRVWWWRTEFRGDEFLLELLLVKGDLDLSSSCIRISSSSSRSESVNATSVNPGGRDCPAPGAKAPVPPPLYLDIWFMDRTDRHVR